MMGTKERNFQPLPEHISLEDLRTPGADICLIEVYSRRYVLALAAGKVVDYGHFVVAPEECFGHVGADKPCAPAEQDPH